MVADRSPDCGRGLASADGGCLHSCCSRASRPLAVRLGLAGLGLQVAQRRPLEWFGARGAASLYCLGLAVNRGLGGPFAQELAATALVVVVASIVFSTVSAISLGKASPGPGAVDL